MQESLIQVNDNLCTACYLCVRSCPVKAIHINEESVFPQVDESKCIGCGECLSSCAYHAIFYNKSIDPVIDLLKSGKKVIALCDPAIAGEFSDISDYRKFVSMLCMLGFKQVMEVSFGVDLISQKYTEFTQKFKGKYYITSHCPAIVELIEKYYPDSVENLLPVITPAAATAIVARQKYGKDSACVVISPCIAIKKGIDRYKDDARIDLAITFEELRTLFHKYHITEGKVEYAEFDPPLGYKGSLFPIPEGFLESNHIETSILKGNTISASGRKDVLSAIRSFSENNHILKRNFNLFFCKGCLCGPGNTTGTEKYLRHTYVADYASKRIAQFDMKQWNSEKEMYSDSPALNSLYQSQSIHESLPDKAAIEKTLELLKGSGKMKQPNCGLCGFGTCQNLAIAITKGIAIPELCVAHSIADAKKYNFALKNTDIALQEYKKKNESLQQQILAKEVEVYDQNNAFSILIRRINSGVVIINELLKIIDSNQSFVEILGDDAKDIGEVIPFLIGADIRSLIPEALVTQINYVLSDNTQIINRDIEIEGKLINIVIFQLIQNKLVGVILRDMHSVQERPDEIIARVNEVIDENLKQVQQIGFILGEGAAKTEKMLNSIIKSYNKKEENNN